MTRLTSLLSAALVAGSTVAMAQPGFSLPQTTGLVGIAAGQAAHLNITRPDLPAPLAAATTCAAAISIRESTGQILKSQTIPEIAPGQSFSLTLTADTDLPAPPARTEIRGVISADPDPQSPPLCELAVTLEIYDVDTGKTTVVLEGITSAVGPLRLGAGR